MILMIMLSKKKKDIDDHLNMNFEEFKKYTMELS